MTRTISEINRDIAEIEKTIFNLKDQLTAAETILRALRGEKFNAQKEAEKAVKAKKLEAKIKRGPSDAQIITMRRLALWGGRIRQNRFSGRIFIEWFSSFEDRDGAFQPYESLHGGTFNALLNEFHFIEREIGPVRPWENAYEIFVISDAGQAWWNSYVEEAK